jgi:hypothetical protein
LTLVNGHSARFFQPGLLEIQNLDSLRVVAHDWAQSFEELAVGELNAAARAQADDPGAVAGSFDPGQARWQDEALGLIEPQLPQESQIADLHARFSAADKRILVTANIARPKAVVKELLRCKDLTKHRSPRTAFFCPVGKNSVSCEYGREIRPYPAHRAPVCLMRTEWIFNIKEQHHALPAPVQYLGPT